MNSNSDPTPKPTDPAPADPFRELVAKVMQTPKAEVDRREAEYQREREGKPKPGPKPKPERN